MTALKQAVELELSRPSAPRARYSQHAAAELFEMWSTMLAAGIPAFRALEILASNSEWKDSLETVLEKISLVTVWHIRFGRGESKTR